MAFQSDRYKYKIKYTNNFILKHIGYPLLKYIEICSWKEDKELCKNVINDQVPEENKSYLKKKFRGLDHLRDRRTHLEYALDLILGWAVEDAMREVFTETLELNTSLMSADRNREFLLRPQATSDFIISHNDQEHYVEVVSDYTGFWAVG